MPIRVLILDSSDIIRAGLRDTLESAGSIDVIGETADCTVAQRVVSEHLTEVVILDLGSTDTSRLEFITFLQHQHPATRVLVFTSRDCMMTVRKYIAAGVDGYLIKESSGKELIAAVEAVAAGRKVVSISDFGEFYQLEAVGRNVEPESRLYHRSDQLSEREREVLAGLARGRTNQQIADDMFLSVKTIETYRSRLTKKIGARSRAELFEFANSSGMLTETHS